MSKRRIVVIGPVYPYKGGISHYTSAMVRSLAKIYDVVPVSYKMQYPKILFHSEQKDFGTDMFHLQNVQFLLHTANPFNWLSTARKIRKMRPDAVILQWWHPYFSPCYTVLTSRLKKIPVIFVCHNVFPHERFPMDKALTRAVLKKGSAFITHSDMDAQDLQGIVKSPLYETTLLPMQESFRMRGIGKAQARAEIGIPAEKKVLLFFGFVREYKGLRHIIDAMPEIVKFDSRIELLIAGEFRSDKETYLARIQELGVEENIRIVDAYIPDSGIEPYFACADLVILPYESATQSGIVQIAYAFEKPVIATDVGGLPEAVPDGKTGYIVRPRDPRALAGAVIRFYRENREEEFMENVRREAYRCSWDRMNEAVKRLMEKIDGHEAESEF